MRRVECNRKLSVLTEANRFPGGLKPVKSAMWWNLCWLIRTTEEMLSRVVEPAEKACFVSSCSCMNSQSSSPLPLGVSDAATAASTLCAPTRSKCAASA